MRERAESFLANAEELAIKGNYDLAAFNLECEKVGVETLAKLKGLCLRFRC
ncbi:MAG: hypothetical protein QW738_09165 [Nitrososphaeria archaeon]